MSTETVEATVESPVEDAKSRSRRGLDRESRLYRVVWRWHFYAGLIVAPVILVAAITGGLYVFAEEIDGALNRQLLYVAPGPERVPLEKQIAAATSVAADGEKASAVELSADPINATVVNFSTADARLRSVYVNPYTGAVTGQRFYDDGLMAIVLEIHMTLLAGTFGQIVVELATGWGIVLAITGIYLWWPRKREKVRGVWSLRITKARPYTFVRDLHTVPGLYASILVTIIFVTGLFFSYVFGRAYIYTATLVGQYPQQFLAPPQSTVPDPATDASIDRVVGTISDLGLDRNMYLVIPGAPTDTYVAYLGDAGSPTTRAAVWVDRYSGDVLTSAGWADASAMYKASILAYPLHVGSIYGLPTKILAVAMCILIVAMTVTGAIMWWMRRPKAKSGFPRKPERKVPVWLVGTILAIGVLVPTVGLSILLMLLWDLLYFAGRNVVARRTA